MRRRRARPSRSPCTRPCPALGLGGPGVSIEVAGHAVEEQRREPRAATSGGSALVELTWLGILLLVPLLWIVLSVFEVQRGAFATSAAARAAGRAYALAPTDAEGRAQAEAAARQASPTRAPTARR